jgi:hypothetical protein
VHAPLSCPTLPEGHPSDFASSALQVVDDIVSRGAKPDNIRVIAVVVAPPAMVKLANKYKGAVAPLAHSLDLQNVTQCVKDPSLPLLGAASCATRPLGAMVLLCIAYLHGARGSCRTQLVCGSKGL